MEFFYNQSKGRTELQFCIRIFTFLLKILDFVLFKQNKIELKYLYTFDLVTDIYFWTKIEFVLLLSDF